MAIELATAYVSLVPETTKLEAGIKAAFTGVSKQADITGKDVGTRLARTASKAMRDGWTPDKDIMAGIPNTKLDRIGARMGQLIGKGVSAGIKGQQLGRDFGQSFASGAGSIGLGSVIRGWSSDLKGQSNKLGFVAGKALSAGLQTAMVAGTAGLGFMLKSGFDRLVTLDTAQYKLKQILKSQGKTDPKDFERINKAVQATVDKTPFSLDQAFGTAVNAIGAGSQDIERFMANVADAAGFAGVGLDRMGLIFNQVLAKGKLTGEETMQLMEAGLPARSWIQASYKLTAEQYDKMQEDGELTLDMLQKSIEDHAPGMAKALGGTLQGSIDNMKTSFTRTGANLLAALLGGATGDPTEGLKTAVQRITEMLNKMNAWVIANKDNIRDFFTAAVDAAKKLAGVLGEIAGFLKEHPGLVQAAVGAFVAFKTIAGVAALAKTLGSVADLLKIGLPSAAATGATGIGAALAKVAVPAWLAFLVASNADSIEGWIQGKTGMPSGQSMFDDAQAKVNERLGIGGGMGSQQAGPNASRMRRGLPPVGGGNAAASILGNAAGVGLQSGQWADVDAIAQNNFGLSMTSGFRPAAGPTIAGVPAAQSFHSTGQAHDFNGTPEQMLAFANYMADNYGPQLKELIFDAPGFEKTIKNGEVKGPFGSYYTMDQAGNHADHVHVAFDSGGWLQPGSTMAYNGTGKPELILTAEQQQKLADQGIDPGSLLHSGSGAAPGPPETAGQPSTPDYGGDFLRSMGFVPQSAGNTGVAGTSTLAKTIGMGNDIVGGIIDTGTNLAQTAVSAAIAGGTMGAGAAAGPAAGAAASYGIELAGKTLKRISSYGFQMAGIGADALMEQMMPFGAPRWLGYDYTAFAPQLGVQQALTGTLEKMGADAINQRFGQPTSEAAAPVQPNQLPGMAQTTTTPPEGQPHGGQGGQPPGPGDVLNNLFKFDQGGMLQPGQVGVNMTRRPEPVLTPQQWDAIAASSSSPAPVQPLVGNLYTQDMQDAIRQLDKVKRRDMMQYAGRP